MLSTIFGFVSNIIKPVADCIDSVHTSDEEKLKLRNELAKMTFEMNSKVLEYENKLLESRASIINSEARSSHWLTASWRPIVMLSFTAIVIARWFGLTSSSITPVLEAQLFDIIKLGLTGYIAGRSLEKAVKSYKKK